MKSICESLAKPSEANARALANLFPATKKRKFDPLSISVNSNSKRKKTAFSNKGRSKLITVVCLDCNSGMIPRGSVREKLRSNGRISDIAFFRYLTYEDIKGIIEQAFSLKSKLIFLKSQKNNLLCIAERQELNGAEVIHLAGKGALYLLSAEMESMVSTTKSFPEVHSPSVPSLCVSLPCTSSSSPASLISSSCSRLRTLLTDSDSSILSPSSPLPTTSSQLASPCCSYSPFFQEADKILENLKVCMDLIQNLFSYC